MNTIEDKNRAIYKALKLCIDYFELEISDDPENMDSEIGELYKECCWALNIPIRTKWE